MEICPPVGIARLPKPFGENAKCSFGPVWGLKKDSGDKKKRQEICAAIDGDSVNVYNVSVQREQQSSDASQCRGG
jgi:hypothetical protein